MLKITNENYRLPQIHALEGLGLMETGTTAPMKIRGVDIETLERGQYIVKFHNSGRMSIKSSCRELLGAWIAQELGLNVIEPVVVDINENFLQLIIGKSGYQAAQKSVGFNFGSVYKAGFQELVEGKNIISNSLLKQAQLVFMFDMFISNADRGAGKPNVMTDGSELLIFDHELGFSFADLLSFSQNPQPWIIGPSEREMFESHYFYKNLRYKQINFRPIVERLDLIDDSFWQSVDKHLPTNWKSDDVTKIRAYLTKIVENKDIFAQQLTNVLLS